MNERKPERSVDEKCTIERNFLAMWYVEGSNFIGTFRYRSARAPISMGNLIVLTHFYKLLVISSISVSRNAFWRKSSFGTSFTGNNVHRKDSNKKTIK